MICRINPTSNLLDLQKILRISEISAKYYEFVYILKLLRFVDIDRKASLKISGKICSIILIESKIFRLRMEIENKSSEMLKKIVKIFRRIEFSK